MKIILLLLSISLFLSCATKDKAQNKTEEKKEVKTGLAKAEYKESVLDTKDMWGLLSLDNIDVDVKDGSSKPIMELDIDGLKMKGNDGCNQFSGKIELFTESNIKFGPAMSTMMMCPNMDMTNLFNQNLIKVTNYKREGSRLFFYDDNSKELMQFVIIG